MKRLRAIKVSIRQDEESGVWYVHDSNLPGLHAEADSPEELKAEVLSLIPVLIESSAMTIQAHRTDDHLQVPIDLLMHSREYVSVGC